MANYSAKILIALAFAFTAAIAHATSVNLAVTQPSPPAILGQTPESATGQPVTLMASISSAPSSGFVIFYYGGSAISGHVAVPANGSASYTTSFVASSAYFSQPLTASYFDANGSTAASNAIQFGVVSAPAHSTLTFAPGTPTSVQDLSTTPITVQLSGAGPTGTVQFKDGFSNPIGGPVAVTGGQATGQIRLTVDSHSLQASYSGDQFNAPASSGLISFQITGIPNTVPALPSWAIGALVFLLCGVIAIQAGQGRRRA